MIALQGLELGSDDYLKPFHLSELSARIKAFSKEKFDRNNEIRLEELNIDPAAQMVKSEWKGNDIDQKEFDLLVYFVMNKTEFLQKLHCWTFMGDVMDQADEFDFIYTHKKIYEKKFLNWEAKTV